MSLELFSCWIERATGLGRFAVLGFFWVSGAGTCGDGNYPAREEDYWNILFGMRVILVTGEV